MYGMVSTQCDDNHIFFSALCVSTVLHQRTDRVYASNLGFIFEPLRSRERITILKAVLDMEYDVDVFVNSGIVLDCKTGGKGGGVFLYWLVFG